MQTIKKSLTPRGNENHSRNQKHRDEMQGPSRNLKPREKMQTIPVIRNTDRK